MFPKITIITPTFNQGEFIEKSILSVLNQNYPNLEYIIIDGGSTDITIDIIKKYENKITYWVSEKDKGQSNAINKGLFKASGDIINWLNSDDFLEPNALHTIATIFSNEMINVVAGYSSYIDELGTPIANMKFRTSVNGKNIFSIITNTSINQPSTFFRKKVFDEITPINEELHYNMDLYMWLRYLCIYGTQKIFMTDKNLSIVTLHQNAKTIKYFEKTFPEKQFIYNALFDAANNKPSKMYIKIEAFNKNKVSVNELKKYYYRYRIFKRKLTGERESVLFVNIFKYIYFSIKTL